MTDRTGQPVRLADLTTKSIVRMPASLAPRRKAYADTGDRYVYKDKDGWFVYVANGKHHLTADADGVSNEGVTWP